MQDKNEEIGILGEIKKINEKLEKMDQRIEEGMDNVDKKFDSTGKKLDRLEAGQALIGRDLNNLRDTVYEFESNNIAQHDYTHTLINQAFNRMSSVEEYTNVPLGIKTKKK